MKTVLEILFERHYPEDPYALKRFRGHIAQARLDFDVETSIGVLEAPPQASFPVGLPPFVYYYIYGTNFGTVKKLPATSENSTHTFTSDGIGLNMGCPIRLARALDVLFSLKPEDQNEPAALIRARKNHFACVEELLWLTVWKRQTEIGRGGELVPKANGVKSGNIDWLFFSDGTPIFLEVKFRPTDWMRRPECGSGVVDEGFFDDIGHKFPTEKSAFRRCLVAITGFAEPITDAPDFDNGFLAMCEKKLSLTPGLDAILYRTLLGPIYVCSLDRQVVADVSGLIRFPAFHEYPPSYPIIFNRKLRDGRVAAKEVRMVPQIGRLVFAIVPDNQPSPTFQPKYPYHCNIPKRGQKGQPQFQNIPPFLKAPPDEFSSNP